MPRVFAEHSGRGRGAQGGTPCLWAAVPAPWARASPEASQGPWCWEPFPSRPREQVPRVAVAVGRSPAFVPSPIPPASSLPSSDGGRRWQAASPTRLTGRAGLGEPRAPAPCPDPPGPCRGSPGRSGQEGHPGPGPPCGDSAAAPGTRGTGAATLCWVGASCAAARHPPARWAAGTRPPARWVTQRQPRLHSCRRAQSALHGQAVPGADTAARARTAPRARARAAAHRYPGVSHARRSAVSRRRTRRHAESHAAVPERVRGYRRGYSRKPPPNSSPMGAHTHGQTGCTQQDGSPSHTRVPFPPPPEDARVAPGPAVASCSSSCSQLPEEGLWDGQRSLRGADGAEESGGVPCPAPALGQLEATGKGTQGYRASAPCFGAAGAPNSQEPTPAPPGEGGSRPWVDSHPSLVFWQEAAMPGRHPPSTSWQGLQGPVRSTAGQRPRAV